MFKLESKKNFVTGILGLIGASIFYHCMTNPADPDVVERLYFGQTLILVFISLYFVRDGIGDAWRK